MNYINQLYGLLVYGKEKAFVGSVVSGVLSLLAQVGINGQMTVKEALASLGVAVLTHVSVYLKSNQPK